MVCRSWAYRAVPFPLKQDWLIIYCFTSSSIIFYLNVNIEVLPKFRPMLGARGLWAGRDLYRGTSAVTQGLSLSCLILGIAPFHHLFWHTRRCGRPIPVFQLGRNKGAAPRLPFSAPPCPLFAPLCPFLYIYCLLENNWVKFDKQVENQLAPHTSCHQHQR
jgi:hypothetical protein